MCYIPKSETVSSPFQIVEEHESVEQSRRAQAEPINLDSCLRAFTSEEELGEDEMYYCSKCKTHCLATKKLDLWRLPPILVGSCLIFLLSSTLFPNLPSSLALNKIICFAHTLRWGTDYIIIIINIQLTEFAGK